MAKWILKAVIQKTISYLPYKEKINFFFQKNVTKGVDLNDEHFEYKLDAGRDHIRYYKRYGSTDISKSNVLELGAGWYPIVPTMLFLAGFKQTTSIDISPWMNRDRQLIAFRRILDYFDTGALNNYIDDIKLDRIEALRALCKDQHGLTMEQMNQRICLDYLLMDATDLAFKNDHFDFICSNNTFEHIYPEVLFSILAEFKRVLKPDGLMSHFVDLSDHFAHMDSSINIYNFLKFSRSQWKAIDNSIQPQNRLRWSDYIEMYEKLGIPIQEENYRKGSIDLLRSVKVNPEYAQYPDSDLAISHGYIVS